MSKEITSDIIGQLKQDDKFPDWWRNCETVIPFFDHKKLPIVFMDYEPEHDPDFAEQADQALANFLGLSRKDRFAISSLVYKNCTEFLNAVGYDEADDALRQITDPNEIWNFVYPGDIYVTRRPCGEKDIYVMIACECAWEQEHGLQLVFRQGRKVTRVSEQDGHLTEADACDKPDAEDELLSQF